MANTTNYNWETPDDTDLVKDGAAAIRTLGSSIDTTTKNLNPETTTGDIAYRSATANTNTRLGIGTTGQVLTVAAGVPSWATPTTGDIEGVTAGTGISGGGTSGTVTVTNSMATAIDAKGDLIGGTGADTFARLAVGANGTVLTADSAETTGLKWATPAGGGGKVLQVVSATTTTLKNIATTTQTDTNITATITPTSATSKILVLVSACFRLTRNANGLYTGARLQRGATSIADFGDYKFAHLSVEASSLPTRVDLGGNYSITYLDNPATTSATTYKVQAKVELTTNSAAIDYQYGDAPSTITLLEIGA
jgi:hypothetical protein